MAYELLQDSQNGIISVVYSGTVDLIERLQAVSDVCDRFADIAPLKILVDVKGVRNGMTPSEQEDFGLFLSRQYQLRHARVAVLHSPGYNPNDTINRVAASGGYTVTEFSSKTEAIAWLSGV